ncbi:MAG: HD domain-containing protein [Clostridia bacterium]|nr:HD domain-containing protein [Clostridia bacterium]
MLFIRQEDLKTGMRLAKPIYNKKGVLLYERNSKLTTQGIESIKNFGLIGIYILEPAEPLPPMTQDDIEFERFQTMCVFSIQEELMFIQEKGKYTKLPFLADTIIRSYGVLDRKINFVQNLRSSEDYVYKHSLNVAILCALIGHQMNMRREELSDTICAAVIHDIGKLNIPPEIMKKGKNLTDQEAVSVRHFEYSALDMIDQACRVFSPSIKRIVQQAFVQRDNYINQKPVDLSKVIRGAKILIVAEAFDTMTAMNYNEEPASEVKALRELMQNPEIYDEQVVDALIKSVNFLAEGCSVELSNGEKGLVLAANENDILKPMILLFRDNSIIDLRQQLIYDDLEIKDIMKTLDNRNIMDQNTINALRGEKAQSDNQKE